MICIFSAGPERLPIMIIGPLARVFQRIKRTSRDECGLTWLESRLAAIGEAHRAFSFEDDKSLVSIMAMHGVLLPPLVVVHPGMKPRRIENVLATLFGVSHVHQVDYFDAHDKFLLALF